MKTSESAEQSALFKWRDYNLSTYPDLRWMHHIPNGGARDIITAVKLKAEGVTKGIPDICIPCPKGGYHGMYIEMKIKGNHPTDAQRDCLEYLNEQGYYACVAYGWEEAVKAIIKYMGVKE